MFTLSVNVPAIDNTWGSWSTFGSCSTMGGVKTRNRTRTCDQPHTLFVGQQQCRGGAREQMHCQEVACPDGEHSTSTIKYTYDLLVLQTL